MACGKEVPFTPGRGDATEEQTDAASFSVMEPVSCGFRNYLKTNYAVSPEEMMLDKARALRLTGSEMTVLVGGMRSLGVSSDERGLFTDGSSLSNEWFDTLLDMELSGHQQEAIPMMLMIEQAVRKYVQQQGMILYLVVIHN